MRIMMTFQEFSEIAEKVARELNQEYPQENKISVLTVDEISRLLSEKYEVKDN